MLKIIYAILSLILTAAPAFAQTPTTIIISGAPVYSNNATITAGNAATHTLASRINAGTGCNKSGYINGGTCYEWQALNAGTTSASGDPTSAWTCGAPAGVANGGIYKTSFPGASTQTDNGITFACLWPVDNVTESEAYNDTTTNWGSSTQYYAGTYVRASGVIFQNITTGLTNPWKCTSSSGSAPAAPGFGNAVSDGTCTWQEVVSHPVYSSQANVWQHQLCDATAAGSFPCHASPQFSAAVTIYIAHEGHDIQAYIPGQNNEDIPILEWSHFDYWADASPTPVSACSGFGFSTCPVLITAPVGDRFIDNISPSAGPLAATPGRNFGVLLQSNMQPPLPANGGVCDQFCSLGEPVAFSDTGPTFEGLQFQSLYGQIGNQHGIGPGWSHDNFVTLRHDTLDSGGSWGTIEGDYSWVYDSDLIINRSLIPGSYGIIGVFGTFVYDSTIIGNNTPNSVAISTVANIGTSYWYNNLILGFPFPNAITASSPPVAGSGNNGTSVASGTIGTSFLSSNPNLSTSTFTAQQLTGTSINSMVPTNELVQPLVQSPVQVQTTCKAGTYNVTSQACSFTTVASNETAVLFVNPNATISSVVTGGLTWTVRQGSGGLLEYVAPVPTAGSYTVTVTTTTTSGLLQIALIASMGTPTAGSVYDPNGSLPAPSATAPVLTTTQPNDVLMAAYTCSNQIFSAAGATAGWAADNAIQMFFQYRNVNAVQTLFTPTISSPCTVTAALGDALIQNPVASSVNALLTGATAQSYGAGTMTLTGLLTSPSSDILGQSRASRVDLGAVNFSPGSGLNVGGGRSFFR